ncbi:MAG: hypothetical protein M1832_005933 [Thelocarpon impressellum]|nr:MAG: hypothetical protein M1832_005933 [Thelocarpon impressellum]
MAVAQVAGSEASVVLGHAMARSRSSRYGLRSRREERLGDLADSWLDFQTAFQHACNVSARLQRSTLQRELRRASTLAQSVIGTLAACVPARSMARTQDRAERFIDNVYRHHGLRDLQDEMEASIEALGEAVLSSVASLEESSIFNKRTLRDGIGWASDEDDDEFGDDLVRPRHRTALSSQTYISTSARSPRRSLLRSVPYRGDEDEEAHTSTHEAYDVVLVSPRDPGPPSTSRRNVGFRAPPLPSFQRGGRGVHVVDY